MQGSSQQLQVTRVQDLWAEVGIQRSIASMLPVHHDLQQLKRPTHEQWAAVGFTLLVHLLLVGMFGLSGSNHASQARGTNGIGSSEQNGHAREFVSVMVTSVNLPPSKNADIELPERELRALKRLDVPPPVIPLDEPTITIEADAATNAEVAAQLAASQASAPATLVGLYFSQIKARIGRVWEDERPEPVSSFQCQVQITQDALGNVGEISFRRCDRDKDGVRH